MGKIEIPKKLNQLLDGSSLAPEINGFVVRVGEILADNKLAFFPNYTDHGCDHITAVLKTIEDRLVPLGVWDQSKPESKPRLLNDADAALIVGGNPS